MSENSIFKEHKKLMKLKDKYNSLMKEYEYDIEEKKKMHDKYKKKYISYAEKIQELYEENKKLFNDRYNESDKKRKNRKYK